MARFSRFIGISITMAALAATAGFAQTTTGAARPGVRARGERVMAGLNLTDAQRTQIRTLRDQHRTEMREPVQHLREARRALRAETFADAPDQAKLDSLKEKASSLSQQVEARRLELHQQIAQILTPEQRKYMRDHQPQMRRFHGRARGRGL